MRGRGSVWCGRKGLEVVFRQGRKEFVASLQVFDVEQAGVFADQRWVESGKSSLSGSAQRWPTSPRRSLRALLVELFEGLFPQVEELVSQFFGAPGIRLGKEASEPVQDLFPGHVTAMLPFPEGLLRSADGGGNGKALDRTSEGRHSQLDQPPRQSPTTRGAADRSRSGLGHEG